MGGEEQNAFAALEGALEVSESVVHHDVGHVFPGVLREKTNLGRLSSKGNEDTSQDAGALARTLFRKSQLEVDPTYPPQAAMQQVNRSGQRDASGAGQRARQGPDKLNQDPGQSILQSLTHGRQAPTVQRPTPDVKPQLASTQLSRV